MSASESSEPLAPWAFRAALSGLPDDQLRALFEGDRVPEPEVPSWAEDVESLRLEESGAVVVFAPDEDEAWIQSDRPVALAEMR